MKVFDAKVLKNPIYLFAIAILLSGCGIKNLGKDSVLFVTKTSLGVDVDSKPPTFDVGFNRTEGTLGPVSEDGKILPLMAGFDSENGIVNQAIGQSFATGNASIIMSKHLDAITRRPKRSTAVEKSDDEALLEGVAKITRVPKIEKRRRYFFGTKTSFAFRVNFGMETGGLPDSLSLGYKRKEFAFVPLMDMSDEDKQTKDVAIPSLLATSGLKTAAPSFRDLEVVHNQFFATGSAAKYLAFNPEIRAAVAPEIAPEAIKAIKETKVGLKTTVSGAATRASSTIAITPSTTSVLVGTTKAFTGSGGTPPYTYDVASGGGQVSKAGLYRADVNPGSATVRVTDNQGATADSTVTVVSLMLTAPTQTVAIGSTLLLTPVGGTAPYTYTVPIGTGTVTSPGATSTYTSPPIPGSETVRVTDNVGDTADLTVTVVSLMLTASTQTVAIGSTLLLTPVGGTAPYTYTVPIGTGTVTSPGATSTYTPPPSPGSETVRVTDNMGISADLTVTITR